jgi:hypothetical protein
MIYLSVCRLRLKEGLHRERTGSEEREVVKSLVRRNSHCRRNVHYVYSACAEIGGISCPKMTVCWFCNLSRLEEVKVDADGSETRDAISFCLWIE